MTDSNSNALWGQLRSLGALPLGDHLLDEYGHHISPDADRAVKVAYLLREFEAHELEVASEYAIKALVRVGVDSELTRTAIRFLTFKQGRAVRLGRFFAGAREGYLGQVYTSDYQGNVEAYYLDDGVLYKTLGSYGSCSYCCSFQAASEVGTASEVLESFRLRGMCKVVHENPNLEDVKHLVEMCHDNFVRNYGEYQTVSSYYTDPSWDFLTEPQSDEEEEEDYDDSWDHY